MTEKLYDSDSYIKEFSARVISCTHTAEGYEVILSRTAFFPEEGGQTCDRGKLDAINVDHVKRKGDEIYHLLSSPLDVGKEVSGEIDFSHRYYNMQHHTGEHIISGIVNKLYGYENVGFHLSCDGMTVDFSGELSRDELEKIEILANRAIYANKRVIAYYPSEEELKKLEYRSKLDLHENVRIVKIEDTDICACCAPHVRSTGEIGIIKILDAIRYKGGVRLSVKCGLAALSDYNERYKASYAISTALSVKQNEIYAATERLLSSIESYKITLSHLRREICELKLKEIQYTDGNICLFEKDGDLAHYKELANKATELCSGAFAIFIGNDHDGYKYAVYSRTKDLSDISRKMKEILGARGGGSKIMIQGSVTASMASIKELFDNN